MSIALEAKMKGIKGALKRGKRALQKEMQNAVALATEAETCGRNEQQIVKTRTEIEKVIESMEAFLTGFEDNLVKYDECVEQMEIDENAEEYNSYEVYATENGDYATSCQRQIAELRVVLRQLQSQTSRLAANTPVFSPVFSPHPDSTQPSQPDGRDSQLSFAGPSRNTQPTIPTFPAQPVSAQSLPPQPPHHLPTEPTRPSSQSAPEANLAEQVARLINLYEQDRRQTSDRSGVREVTTKLPTMELSKFSGDLLLWKPFWDRFSRAVDQNRHLSDADKLNYLHSLLEGEAQKCVAMLPLTNENYTVAVDILRQRYGNTNAVVASLYRKFQDLKAPSNDPSRLRTFCGEVDTLLGALQGLGQNVDGDHLVSMIMSKLPEAMVLALENTKPFQQKWTVNHLQTALNEQILRIEQTARICNRKAYDQKAANFEYTADALVSAGSSKGVKPPRKPATLTEPGRQNAKHQSIRSKYCVYCKSSSHYADECNKYRTSTERRAVLASTNRCTLCLREGHRRFDCRSRKTCFYCKKVNSHHSSLCIAKFGERNEHAAVTSDSQMDERNENRNAIVEHSTLAFNECVVLQTANAKFENPQDTRVVKEVRALFDCASSRSYVTESTAKQLKLKIENTNDTIVLNRFGTAEKMHIPAKTANLNLILQDQRRLHIVVTVVPQITGNLHREAVNVAEVHRIAKKLTLADTLPRVKEQEPLGILIGNDHYLDIITGEKLTVREGLYLLGSHLGWILSGRIPAKSVDPGFTICCQTVSAIPNWSEIHCLEPMDPVGHKCPDMSDMWSLESLGVTDSSLEPDDKYALSQVQNSIAFAEGRYHVRLPWRSGAKNELPDNYTLSFHRFNTLMNRFKDQPELFQKYAATFIDQLNKGVIEKVEEPVQQGSRQNEGTVCHYLPHHAVVTPQKTTTKVRPVFDGSAKARRGSPSLNESLLRGPVFLESILGILIRFRLNRIALISDIEKAFLQVGIQLQDRDALRFLWLNDPSKQSIHDNLGIYRFRRVPFGAISSPFLLAVTLLHHLSKYQTSTAKAIAGNLYVDNVITGTDSTENAKTFYQEAKSIFDNAGMNLREWLSNDREFMNSIPEKDRASGGKVQKVLGITWDTENDNLSIACPKTENCPLQTKRDLLSHMSSYFDPLGLIAPCTISAKRLMQQLCRKGLKWDQTVDEAILRQMKACMNDMQLINDVQIPRYIPNDKTGNYRLACFTDASETVYSAVLYLLTTNQGNTKSTIILAKSRLNPMKSLTIPRLELMGIVIGVRLLSFAKKNLSVPIQGKTIFSDSQIALSQVTNVAKTSKKETWVKNRVDEIRKSAIPEYDFHYVQSADNPADWVTRGKKATELTEFWFCGPKWLTENPKEWPTTRYETTNVDETSSGRIQEIGLVTHKSNPSSPFGINHADISCLGRLLRITVICTLFVNVLKKLPMRSKVIEGFRAQFDARDIADARNRWIRYVQQNAYPAVINAVKCGKSHEMQQLGLELNSQGVLVCTARLGKARHLPITAIKPILLPRNDPYTILLLRRIHLAEGHCGVDQVVSSLRQSYWVPGPKWKIIQIISKCVGCRKWQGKPYKQPPMPELPEARVTPHPAFTFTGVDYFGPMQIRSNRTIRKVWIALFTCLTVRAVHLELVYDLSAREFLLALRRFIARRGRPQRVLSDNGPQFGVVGGVCANWKAVVNDPDVINFCANQGIEWKFITAYSPWMGGVFERAVGIVKNPLRKVLGKSILDASQLQTILYEVEAIVNNRPLTYSGQEFPGVQVITPRHFLMLNPVNQVELAPIDEDLFLTRKQEDVLELWKTGQHLLTEFWKVWVQDYLLSLRSRLHYDHKKRRTAPFAPKVGHLVLIKESGLPRGSWRVGKVAELLPSSDGAIRSALVQLPTGRKLARPVNLLCPFETTEDFEIHEESEKDIEQNNEMVQINVVEVLTTPVEQVPASSHPQRQTGFKARTKWHW